MLGRIIIVIWPNPKLIDDSLTCLELGEVIGLM